jgi:PadR family transcriptional regulator PadR
MLNRMLAEEWLSANWENEAEAIDRPPRRYYELTDSGRRELGAVLARAQSQARYGGLNWRYAR